MSLEFDHSTRELVKAILLEKGAMRACPRCKGKDFQIIEGFTLNFIHRDLPARHLTHIGIPAVIVVCTRCGYLAQHDLDVIGLHSLTLRKHPIVKLPGLVRKTITRIHAALPQWRRS